MKKFAFRAKDWSGKTIKGIIDAPSKQVAVESVRNSGLVPMVVEEKRKSIIDDMWSQIKGRIGLKQVTEFTRQLSTMLTAGLPLTDALSLLKNQQEGGGQMSNLIEDALNGVRGGRSLGDSLEKYRGIFGEAYVASIRAGEEGGVLEEVLEKLAINLENEGNFKGKVVGAMIYPTIVVIGMVAVMFIMIIFVIPKLNGLYSDFGSKMPAMTRALMTISDVTIRFWFLIPVVPFGIIFLSRMADQNNDWKLKKHQLLLKIPIVGVLMKKTIIANTARTLSMLLSAGIPLVEGIKIVSKVAGNEVYRQAYMKIAEKAEKGFSVSDALSEHEVFPIIVHQMVATGEATGKLDEVLMKVSDYFSTEAEQSVAALTAAMEPLIMIVLGIGVGFLVVAIIMPIYDLTSQF